MNKIRTIGILLMIFLSSIGTVFGESESKILHVYGHDSQTEFGVKIYLNGFEYTIGSGTSSAIVKTTITFDNGDYENIDFDLNGNEKKMSHGVRFELYSHSIATNLVTYEDGLYDGDAMIEVFIESVTTPVPTESPIPASSPIPTVIPTVLSTPTQINLTIESTSLPTPVPTPQRIESSPFGIAFFDSTPRGAIVSIDGRKAGYTPMSRDLSPKGYKISIELEGYPTFNKSIIIRDQEDYPIFVNFNNSKILVESEKNTDELKLSSFVQEENKTENATNVTTQIPSEMTKDSSLFFPATLVVIVLVLVFVLFNRYRAKGRNVTVADASEDANEKDDRSTEDKILDLLTTKGIANIVGRDERTVQKIFKKLREENRFPF